MKKTAFIFASAALLFLTACNPSEYKSPDASEILGNPEYLAISYGGYREKTRDIVPTVEEIKSDMLILNAMGIKIIRTYNTQQFAQASNILKAIQQLKEDDPKFEMYVMLGAWIDCKGAWTDTPDHSEGDLENNSNEIRAAVEMAKAYPDIVKVIAVGNEAMINWAASYYVEPAIILKWVEHLQDLKSKGELPKGLWITSSDNYESWGGGNKSYHTEDLAALVNAVDYVSMHVYPFHETHYIPEFWGVPAKEEELSELKQISFAMQRARDVAVSQYNAVAAYIESLGIEKPIHIGETGWASVDGSFYGPEGTHAADEYKMKLYYEHMREWTKKEGMACFYFEAFDEQWKDPNSSEGSENNFGLINLKGEAKYALWKLVDEGRFKELSRDGNMISKTFEGNEKALLASIQVPPLKSAMGILEIKLINEDHELGKPIESERYIISHPGIEPSMVNNYTYPSAVIKLNPWEGSCAIEMSAEGVIEVQTGANGWWGCALEIQGEGRGENFENFRKGQLHFDIKGESRATFGIGFQTGIFSQGNQTNNHIRFGEGEAYSLSEDWTSYSIPLTELDKGADLKNVTSLLYLRGDENFDGKNIYLRNIYYTNHS